MDEVAESSFPVGRLSIAHLWRMVESMVESQGARVWSVVEGWRGCPDDRKWCALVDFRLRLVVRDSHPR